MARTLTGGLPEVFRGFPHPIPGRRGDPGLFGPGSMVWRVNREAITILGAGRALLMQIAHPLVAAGVADHSGFQNDAFVRLWRTLDAVLTVAFGDGDQVRAATERVADVHRKVLGTRDGREYRALDPALLLWVHSTLVDSAIVSYERFVGPLRPAERERYHEEMKAFAAAFLVPEGIVGARLADLRAYMEHEVAGLEVTAEARRVSAGILRSPAPAALGPLRAVMGLATVGLLPERLRRGFGLSWSPARERALEALAGGCRLSLPALPDRLRLWPHAREAARRMEGPTGE